MPSVVLDGPADFAGWRKAARGLIAREVPPETILWRTEADSGDLFDPVTAAPAAGASAFNVPRNFVDLAGHTALHRDPERFALLYRLLWRLRSEKRLMEVASDADVVRLALLARAVRRDIHKMHAFVRFRSIETDGVERFVAWYEPDNHIVEAASPFFMRRFANLDWTIVTPERAAHWDGSTLAFGPGASGLGTPAGVPAGEDHVEALWCDYYANIFNPARLNPAMMRTEMPVRFWKNLPEAAHIGALMRDAAPRTRAMIDSAPGVPVMRRCAELPEAPAAPVAAVGWEGVRDAARQCRACPLWQPATQTVFGEGPLDARLMFVGEQPGDSEDLAGRPFVGPAGQVFDRALAEAGIDRSQAYVTNAVKHFKFVPRGKRRLHQKPNTLEIQACTPWLEQELAVIKPALVVALGATAAQALFGRATPIGKTRGRRMPFRGVEALVTVHPSYLLRLLDEDARAREYAAFVADLKVALGD